MESLIRKRIGEIPILQTVTQRLRLREILLSYIKPHGNETVPAVDTLLVLVWNIACGRQPLYELPEWVAKLDGGLLGHTADTAENCYGDDRFARALDKLYAADRASMVTDIALRVIETTGVDLSELHNDSTTVKSFGSMPGKTATGLYFTQGHSKDHRPDLKQIVYNLTISADGAIPIHYKTYPGNRTDDTLHIETWNALRQITGKANFLYVADSKVCTHKQLSHIVRHGGRVVTLMPETWKEASAFKATLRQTVKANNVCRRYCKVTVWKLFTTLKLARLNNGGQSKSAKADRVRIHSMKRSLRLCTHCPGGEIRKPWIGKKGSMVSSPSFALTRP